MPKAERVPKNICEEKPVKFRPRTQSSRRGPRPLPVLDYPTEFVRPRTRGDCANVPRPCPWASCKWHASLEVTPSGSLVLYYPNREEPPADQSCVLDIIDASGDCNLDRIGTILGISKERVRQIEETALRKVGPLAAQLEEQKPVVGLTYGHLTVLTELLPDANRYRQVQARCVCGAENAYALHVLQASGVKSCGCVEKTEARARFPDLIGRTFGQWIVTGAGETKICRNGVRPFWQVKCGCGTERQIAGMVLLGGRSRGCGCPGTPLLPLPGPGDLTGRTFGRLLAIAPAPPRERRHEWIFRCACGKEKILSITNVTRGNTQSCGCLKRERKGTKTAKLEGKRLGSWMVLRREGSRPGPSGQVAVWAARCTCGREELRTTAQLAYLKPRDCTGVHRGK